MKYGQFSVLALATVLTLGWGCSRTAEIHSSVGVVRAVRDGGKVVVLEHQEFPGFMGAMTMPFEMKDPVQAQGFEPGDKVEITLEKVGQSYKVSKLDKIGREEAMPAGNKDSMKNMKGME